MKDWGFNNQGVVDAFAFRMEKERKRKALKNKKELTAE
jgi:hypothetical protein